MRRLLRAAHAVVAATCFFSFAADAQTAPAPRKALVYCPVSIDAVGCTNITAALADKYPGGVDRGYDGTSGTVNLRTVDLRQYEVFLVPSLADNAATKPYAFLRDAAVVERLHSALTGRIAMWSGTPDLGDQQSENRTSKNILISRLAAWAGANYAAAGGPGLVTFLDQTIGSVDRYAWVQPIAGVSVVAEPQEASYDNVKPLTAAGTEILTSPSTLAYENMASFGFQLPQGGAGVTADGVAQIGTSDGPVVLVTSPGRIATGPQPVAFYVGAHEDDWSLFMGDRTYASIRSGAPVVLVYLTAGDAGRGPSYWQTRETAANAAANYALGNAAAWSCGTVTIATHSIRRCAKANVVSYFMRMPDGNGDGNGFGFGSLERLRDNTPTPTLDQSTTYVSWIDFHTTLRGIIDHESVAHNASRVDVHSHDFDASFDPNDHVDHWTTGAAVLAASSGKSWNLAWYVAYDTRNRDVNLFGADQTIKHDQYKAYDDVMTGIGESPTADEPLFLLWLTRTYFRTQAPPAQPPVAPTALVAQAVSAGQINLHWTDNSTSETSFRIERAPNNGTQAGTYTEIATTPADVAAYSDVGLTPNTTYWYRVSAVNAAGSSAPSNSVQATTGSVAIQPMTVYVGAHQDDWQIFIGDQTYTSINSHSPVVLIYVTAGEAGRPAAYWQAREAAAEASVNSVVGAGPWACAQQLIAAHAIRRCTKANIASYYLRLPDGAPNGQGFGAGSLTLLRDDGTAVSAVDNSTQYTSWTDLSNTLRAIIDAEHAAHNAPSVVVKSQDYDRTLNPGDHADHWAVGDVMRVASSTRSWNLAWYVDYDTENRNVNLSAADQTIKRSLFEAYDNVMVGAGEFSLLGDERYLGWLRRTYSRTEQPATQPPVAPTELEARAESASDVYLQWTDNSTTETGFKIQRALTAGDGPGAFAEVASLGPNVTSFFDRGLTASTEYWYRVVAVNSAGSSAPSNTASTTTAIACTAPSIESEPVSVTAVRGQPASFSVLATGTAPLGYEWRKNGVPIADADGSSYSIAAVGDADAGTYEVEVTNSCGSVTSTSVTLTLGKRVPVFTGLTAPLTIAYGTSSVAVGGAIGVDGRHPSGSVAVTLGGMTQLAPINATTGAFSATFATSTLAAGTTPYPLTYSYAGDADFESASDNASTTITVGRAAQTIAFTSTAPLNAAYGGSYHPTATGGGSGNAVTFGTTTAAICTMSGANVSFVGIGTCTVTADQAGTANYDAAPQKTQTFSVGKATATIAIADPQPIYDGTTKSASIEATGVNGASLPASSYTVLYSLGGTTVTEPKAAGSYAVTVTLVDPNYTGSRSGSLTVTRRQVTVAAMAASDKTYDGTTAATITGSTLGGIVNEDVVGLTVGAATFPNKNVGSGKTVTATGLALAGAGADNYVLTSLTATTSAAITARPLTVGAVGVDKAYDATTVATVTLTDNRVAGDILSATYTAASFADKNVGAGKPVSVTGISVSGGDAGNYSANITASTTASITPRALAVSAVGSPKEYDGNTSAQVTLSDNRVAGDVLSTTYASAAFANANAGTGKPVTVTGITLTGTDAPNYAPNASANATADILRKRLTGSITASDKTYDGTTNAIAAALPLAGVVAGDAVTLSVSNARFASKNVGTQTVSATIALGGAGAGNYELTSANAAAPAKITPRTLTVTATAADKVYDGNTSAIVTLADNRLAGDVLTVGYGSAAFANKNVGTGKTVSVNGISASGSDGGNYTANGTASTTASILAKTLAGSFTAANRAYDGTRAATVAGSSLPGVVGTDAVTLQVTNAQFDTKHVGNGKPVAATVDLAGGDAGNYRLTSNVASTTASITARALTVSAIGVNKTYDGTTTATVTLGDNRIAGDAVSASYVSASFADKQVGANKAVSVTGIAIAGADAGNYSANATASATASITARALTVGASGVDKVYDGTTSAAVTLTDNRLTGDAVTASYTSASFANQNVGVGKTVTVSGISLSGTDAGNYTANATASTTASILARSLTGGISASDKTYDGTTTAVAAAKPLAGIVSGDAVTLSVGTAQFASRSVGTWTVSAAIQLVGSAAGNYALSSGTATTSATITKKSLTGSFAAASKTYDGTTVAAVASRSLGGVMGTDAVTLEVANARFDTKTVGTGKNVSATFSLSGADAGNYTVPSAGAGVGAITVRALAVGATGTDKIYDGTRTAAASLSDDRIAGDVLSAAYGSATFADANVGSNKTITVTGISITGTDAANYSANGTATATGSITPKLLTGAVTAGEKIYDGTRAAVATGLPLAGAVAGDAVSLAVATASFDSKIVGDRTVTANVVLAGAAAANYQLTSPTATAGARITARSVTGTFAASNKIYDGTRAAMVASRSLPGIVAGDAVALDVNDAQFDTKAAGLGKSVTAGLTLSGADAGNYTVNATTTTTADITPRALAVAAIAQNKVYDGTTTAVVGLTDNRLPGDALAITYDGATFADKRVGTGKSVTVSGIAIDGADKGNYVASVNTTATASITTRQLTVSATGAPKVYDGTTAATVALSDNRIPGDVLSAGYESASFADAAAGTNKSIAVNGITIAGADAANYTANTAASTAADITRKSVTGAIGANDKSYDGTQDAVALAQPLGGAIAGDAVGVSISGASFDSKSVGDRTVTATLQLVGSAAANYQLASPTATAGARITAKVLAGSFTASNKVYDGTTTATVASRALPGVIVGDVVALDVATPRFDTKAVGTGKLVSGSLSLSGADAINYAVNETATATANITPKSLTVTASAQSKVYDGTTDASVVLADDRVSGDILATSFSSATFANANAGTNKVVTVSGIALAGADAGNYTFNTTASAAANITSATPTITWSPTDLTNPSPLTATGQLNAVITGVNGQALSSTAVYSSSGTTVTAGTVLRPGLNTPLTVTFTPNGADADNYTTATKTVTTFNVFNKIDITPNVSANYLYLSSGATEITVAILGTATFDARTVVVSSLTPTLGNGTDPGARLNTNTNGAPKTVLIDINGDGKTDLLCYYRKSDVISAGKVTTSTTQLVLRGQTTDGRTIQGTDKVIVMP